MKIGWLCVVGALLESLAFAWDPSAFTKPTPDALRAALTPLQFEVTQKDGTEPPFRNSFHDHKAPGIYVDIVSGEPLFSSLDKFDSGTGWPSFTNPLVAGNIVSRVDRKFGMTRTEVRSRYADSHLGHVFDDGPKPTGKRYCINSAALRFVAAGDLAKEGYGQFAPLFTSVSAPSVPKNETATAVFAGGCFWCMEPPFEALEGVTSVVSGFMGGDTPNPSYDDVAAGKTGHAEVVQVSYLASRVAYQDLLEVFWKNIDPTVKDRQFCDVGRQYRSAIFFASKEQERLAQQSLEKLRKSGRFKTIHTELSAASTFYPAGPEHQDFYKTNAARYKQYRQGCGRDQRLVEIWAGFSKIFGK